MDPKRSIQYLKMKKLLLFLLLAGCDYPQEEFKTPDHKIEIKQKVEVDLLTLAADRKK